MFHLRLVAFFLFFLAICNIAKSDTVAISEDTTVSSDTSVQQNIDTEEVTLTVSGNAQVDDDVQAVLVDTGLSGASVIVEAGSTITTTAGDNGIIALNSTLLDVTNSGTISAADDKAIDIYRSTDATITNNSGATITSVGNTIRTGGSNADSSAGYTITNSGKIYSTSSGGKSSAIFGNANSSGGTITNNSGAEIYSGGNVATIRVGGTTTITNEGSIKNNASTSGNVIELLGSDNTVTLKEGSILVGKISSGSGTSGNTLKLNLGAGQGYFYETVGDFTLQDLDGNQVVKGSAGSVGQGGSETLDELLSYKSLNLRQFFTKYKNSENFNKNNGWGETYVSHSSRGSHTANLALEYDLINFGANLISPSSNSNFVLAFEGGIQDFDKDHKIKYTNASAGLYFPDNSSIFNLEKFFMAGITLKDAKRTILTNTTSSGKLDIESNYETYEIHTGVRKNNLSLVPDIGLTGSYSFTPNYDESKYYSWGDRHVGNVSVYFSDNYNLIKNKNNKLSLGWTLDYRSLAGDDEQVYFINGTQATYKQDIDLTKEITMIVSLGYEKKFLNNGIITASLNSKDTNQGAENINGSLALKMNF